MELVIVAVYNLPLFSSLGGIRAMRPNNPCATASSSVELEEMAPSFLLSNNVGEHRRCQLTARFFCDNNGVPSLEESKKQGRCRAARLALPLGRDILETGAVLAFKPTGRGPLISRKHCVLQLFSPLNSATENGAWCALCVRDCGSLNGTFVNNHRLPSGGMSPLIMFDPMNGTTCDSPLLTLEFGAGMRLSTGDSLSSGQLQLRFHIFARLLAETPRELVEWIQQQMRYGANKPPVTAKKLDQDTATCESEQHDQQQLLLSPQVLRQGVPHCSNGDDKIPFIVTSLPQHGVTRRATSDVLASILHTHSNFKRHGFRLPTLLQKQEVSPPHAENSTVMENLVDMAAPPPMEFASADEVPVLVVRKRNPTDSPCRVVVAPVVRHEPKSIEQIHAETLASLASEEERVAPLSRHGAPRVEESDDMDIVVVQTPAPASPQPEPVDNVGVKASVKAEPRGKEIGKGDSRPRKRPRAATSESEIIARFMMELYNDDSEESESALKRANNHHEPAPKKRKISAEVSTINGNSHQCGLASKQKQSSLTVTSSSSPKKNPVDESLSWFGSQSQFVLVATQLGANSPLSITAIESLPNTHSSPSNHFQSKTEFSKLNGKRKRTRS